MSDPPGAGVEFGSDLTSVGGVVVVCCTGVDVDEEDLGWEGFREGSLGEKAASKTGASFSRMSLLAFGVCLADRAPDDVDETFEKGAEEDIMMARCRKGEGAAWCSLLVGATVETGS